jgi:hypothetical protein
MQLVEEVAFHNLDRRLASLLIQQGKVFFDGEDLLYQVIIEA